MFYIQYSIVFSYLCLSYFNHSIMSESNEICDNYYFDLNVVYDCFKNCLVSEDNVLLGPYLDAYKELSKFCLLMGSFFKFVRDDIDSKSDILATFRDSDENGNFESLRSMVRHEMDSNLLNRKEYTSGCRTLLRLHRGLDFLRMFLKRVSEAGPTDSTGSIGKTVYNDTLAKFHPWYIKKGADIAMYFLPARDHLFSKVCGDKLESSMRILPNMLEVTDEVYRRTDICYKEFDLHGLP